MSLNRRPLAIAFDCYGTLLDATDDSFIRACERVMQAHGIERSGQEFWQTWLASARVLAKEQGRDGEDPLAGAEPPFESFRERWPRTFSHAFESSGVSGDAVAAYEAFHDTLSQAVAYSDTLPALERLRGHFRLIVVSNADDDHLHHALAENGLEFELILSSEGAQSYKPRAPIFRRAAELAGLSLDEMLYVGDSPVADLVGARAAGMPVVWINRAALPLPERIPAPDLEVRDLHALADTLLAMPAGRPG